MCVSVYVAGMCVRVSVCGGRTDAHMSVYVAGMCVRVRVCGEGS